MKRSVTKIITSMLAVATVSALSIAFVSADASAEQMAIKQAFIKAEELEVQMGNFVSSTGKTSELSDEELDDYIDNYSQMIEQYYSLENPCREIYPQLNEELLKDVYQDEVDYTVESGVLDCIFDSIELDGDGESATIKARCTTWNKWVTENQDGLFKIGALVNEDIITAVMIKEDGQWKLKETIDIQKNFASDPIDIMNQFRNIDSQELRSLESNLEQVDKICEQEFHSFAEAVETVAAIDENSINPFTALVELRDKLDE